MVSINYASREINCKIVYYGPGLSGKTTNLQFVHGKVPSKSRGDLISLATEADRTLYFDFLPVDVGQIAGFNTKFQLYTVPGQVFYDATRRLVLRGVDGLVFVADSQPEKMDENIESLSNMFDNLKTCGIDAESIPLVFQWNKRDLPDVLPVAELEGQLNPKGMPSFEGVATTGIGVFDTLKMITKLVLENAKSRAVARAPAAPPVRQPAPEPVSAGAPSNSSPQWSASSGGSATATQTAPAETTAVPMPSTIHREPSLRVRGGSAKTRPSPVRRAPESLRSRPKRKSLFARIFGWIIGR